MIIIVIVTYFFVFILKHIDIEEFQKVELIQISIFLFHTFVV